MSAFTISARTIDPRNSHVRAGVEVSRRGGLGGEHPRVRSTSAGARQAAPAVAVRDGRVVGGWRLTRRGVIAVVAGALLVVAWILGELSGGVAVGEAVGARSAADGAAVVALVADPGRVIAVAPGDTMWSIAAREYPGTDPRAVVVAIRKANPGLGELWAGMSLRLPDAV